MLLTDSSQNYLADPSRGMYTLGPQHRWRDPASRRTKKPNELAKEQRKSGNTDKLHKLLSSCRLRT
jgi:hypothetical protein